MEVMTASTGSKRVQFNVEGAPVDHPKFEGFEGALGPVGRVRSGYLKTEAQQLEFIKDMKTIATKIGKEEEFNSIESDSFEDYLDKLINSKILYGSLFRWIITGEEYENAGKKRFNLSYARFKNAESISIPREQSKLQWIEKFHLRRMEVTPHSVLEKSAKSANDLPF